uniref:uncharacterized protein LOC117270529 n=1 Tax=Epinephelus lanceolatus TaxID=310571 RepID=UPI0014452A0A|nr:uncharacterized protein LOC117270529 [Epinephelus lanceolatus]
MDLKLLTGAVVLEIHKFASKKVRHYLPHTLFAILDYNFDLSSQHHRRWEFSIATSSKVQAMVKNYHKHGYGAEKVFELPFVCAPKKRPNKKPKEYYQENPNKKTNEGRFVRQVRYHLVSNRVHFLDGFKNDEEPWPYEEDTEFSTDPGKMVQMNGSLVSVGCDSPLQENIQKKEEECNLHYGNMKSEPDTDMIVQMSGSLESETCGSPLQGNIQIKVEEYDPHYGNMNAELDTGTIVQMSGSLESEGCGSPLQGNIQTKEEEYDPQYDNMNAELDTEEKYCPQYDDIKTQPDTEGAEHSVPGEPTEPLGYISMILSPNSGEPQAESESQYVQYYIMAETQGSAECPNIRTEFDTECVQYLVPVDAAESQEYTIVIMGQGNEITVIKEEQENVPADSHHC